MPAKGKIVFYYRATVRSSNKTSKPEEALYASK